MTKKITSWFLAIMLVMSMLPTSVFAAGGAQIASSNSQPAVGGTFDVSFKVPAITEKSYNAFFVVNFDKDYFEVTEFTAPTLNGVGTKMQSTAAEASSNGFFSCSYSGVDDENTIDLSTGTTVEATFKVKNTATAGKSYDFTVDASKTYVKQLGSDGYTETELLTGLTGLKTTVTIPKDELVASKIVLTPPASTTVAVPKSDTPNEIDLPTAAVYDQYGKPMTGTFSITYAIDGGAPTGVTLDTGARKMKVKRTAQAGEVKIVGKLTTAAGAVTSDPVTYTITRETSKVTHVLVSKLYHNMPVPKVTEPGGTSSKDEQFTAEVLDQYLQEMTGQTVTWRVTDTAGNPVTGVSIDNTGKLTVTNEAPGIKVYAIATCQGVDSNNLDMVLHRETAKDTFVVICDQVGDAPETSLLIPTGTVTEKVDYNAKVYDQYGKPTSGMVFWELDKTYTGVELDTISIPGSATLKVDKTAESGTIKLTAKCSTVGSTASQTRDITLTKKTVDTSLTVTQADTTYGTALADPVFTAPEGTIKTLVHYSTPTSSAYSSATKPTDAGEYVVNVVCETATHIYTGHANFKIEPKSISNLLQPITGTYVYSGAPQKPTAVVMDGTKKLVEGTDYTVSYGTNVHVFETATVYVEGKGNYTGTFSRNFKIQPKPIDIEDVKTTNRDYEEGRLDVDCTVTLPVASDVKQGTHYHVYATMDDDTAGTNKTVNVLVKMEKGGYGENYTLNKDTTTAKVNINQINPADPTGLKGVKGQKLSTVELPAGWNWDTPNTVMGTAGNQTFKAHYAGDANHNAVSARPITVYVLDKTDVSAFITFPDGEKEYTGSWMKYEEATISGTNLGTGAKWNYAYTAGTGTLMAAGFPEGIGTYTVTATYEDSINFGIATATLTITAKKVAIPAADTTVFTYDGNAKTYGIADTADYTVTGNSQTNAGDHTVTVALRDKATTAWADGTTADKTYTFTIKQATPTGEPAYTKITTSGKTLADAGLTVTGSTLNPNAGTLKWVDDAGAVLPDTTTVAANTSYKWLYTPADTANYNTLTGSIELYHKSSGGGGGGGSYTPSYTVSVDKTENGTITVSPKSASKGDTVTITVKPDKGYELDTLKVLDKDGDALKLTEKNGKYTFKMPSGKVTVKGSFVEEAPVQIFKDVPVDAYYYEAVKWAAEKGITGGVGNGLFAPNQPCTRAQIVTFLWRAAGSPAPKNMSSFADVPADAFYAKAVAWAVENGITGGTGEGKFSPNATCTRAQSVTFLYRAAGSPAVSGNSAFTDVAADAYYAAAVTWAEKNDITGGIGGGLFGSNNNCTRAQIVTFIYRSVK